MSAYKMLGSNKTRKRNGRENSWNCIKKNYSEAFNGTNLNT